MLPSFDPALVPYALGAAFTFACSKPAAAVAAGYLAASSAAFAAYAWDKRAAHNEPCVTRLGNSRSGRCAWPRSWLTPCSWPACCFASRACSEGAGRGGTTSSADVSVAAVYCASTGTSSPLKSFLHSVSVSCPQVLYQMKARHILAEMSTVDHGGG